MTIVKLSEVRDAIQDMYENEQYQEIEEIINDLELLQEKAFNDDDYSPFQPTFDEK